MPVKYGTLYPDEWWNSREWKEFFTWEINEGIGNAAPSRAKTYGSGYIVFANFGGVVHWKCIEDRAWKTAHRIDEILPLRDRVIFADGEMNPTRHLLSVVRAWTIFVIDQKVKFTGPNRCLNDMTGASGPSIIANRPVPILADSVSWGAKEVFSTRTGPREVPIYTPCSYEQGVNKELDIVYFSAHVPGPSKPRSSGI